MIRHALPARSKWLLPALAALLPSTLAAQTKASQLFRNLEQNYQKVAFAGTRTYTQFLESGRIYRYSETVNSLPARGNRPAEFSLVLTDIKSLTGSVHDLTLRRQAFKLRSGFLFHYRDFRVFDAAAAAKHYQITPMGTVQRLGRTMEIYDIVPRAKRPVSSYRIVVDSRYPLVVDQFEFDPHGRIISALLYDAITIGPVATGLPMEPWKPWMDIASHKSIGEARKRLDFVPSPPQTISDGFQMQAVRTVVHPFLNKPFLVLDYTDGIDTRFVLSSKSNAIEVESPAVGPSPEGSTPVFYYHFGPVAQYLVTYERIDYIVVGTFFEDGVPALVREVLGG